MKRPSLQLTPMADVSAIRNEIGKTALGMLASLLVALVTWTVIQVWATKLDVAVYNDHLAKDALHDQLDSARLARFDRKIMQLNCVVKKITPCEIR